MHYKDTLYSCLFYFVKLKRKFLHVGHPWLADHQDIKIPLDTITYKLVRAYICSSSLRKSALGVSIIKLFIHGVL